ncbi:alpha/beta hydrolase [Chitiniphilus shinanonensis]|uniref:alpha/beta hydrolase n=1 Tax=Chitiniphilus shinanonensis TaxID=553088 RepID=UPI00304216C3
MPTPNVVFDDQGVPLTGSIDVPDTGIGRDVLLLMHGFTGHRMELAYFFVDLGRRLAARGVTVYRFDFRGCGESGGRFVDISVADQIRQIEALMHWLRERHPEVRLHLAGFSMGGLAAAHATARGAAPATLTLIAPAGNLKDVVQRNCDAGVALADGTVDLLALPIGPTLRDELANLDTYAGLARIDVPTLVIQGSADAAVPLAVGRRIAQTIPGARWHEVPDADHIFGRIAARDALARAMLARMSLE